EGMTAYAKNAGKVSKNDRRIIQPSHWGIDTKHNFNELHKILCREKIIRPMMNDPEAQKWQSLLISVLFGIDALLSGPGMYSKYKENIFSSARLILPMAIRKAVVLDATARINPAYRFMENVVDIPKMPTDMRNYKNVTLYVHYNHDVGKQSILAKDDCHFSDLTDYLSEKLGAHESVLLCVHKDAKERFVPHLHKFSNPHLASWGAIDGVDDWKDCDKMVIYGLS